jgi:glucose-1-phosphate cytidylyltransferase
MKVVILAGGLGTRLSEETDLKPKPMVEIGGKPILWHIMKIYSYYGFNEFIVCCGYKGYIIKEYFANYFLHQADVTIDLQKNSLEIHQSNVEPWKITLVDTGLNTMTGGRIKRIQKFVGNETFMLTYGDGVSNINIAELVLSHKKSNKLATLTAVQTLGKFGSISIENDNQISSFIEKPRGDGAWINGGFFVLEPGIFDYITEGDATIWERNPLEKLAKDDQLMAYKHSGFWRPMDTLRDKIELESMWNLGNADWKLWK